MDKLISVAEFKKWIENWQEWNEYYHGKRYKSIPLTKVEYILKQAPSADVVPVIRCKDCRLYHKTEDIEDTYEWCGMWDDVVEADGYCSWAERKGEN